jgi:hypothetical protein
MLLPMETTLGGCPRALKDICWDYPPVYPFALLTRLIVALMGGASVA